jgi:hypothetical protein
MKPTQPPIQWVSGALSLGVKRPRREADHSPPFSSEVKEYVELYLYSPIRLCGVVLSLKTHRDNFTFIYILQPGVSLPVFTIPSRRLDPKGCLPCEFTAPLSSKSPRTSHFHFTFSPRFSLHQTSPFLPSSCSKVSALSFFTSFIITSQLFTFSFIIHISFVHPRNKIRDWQGVYELGAKVVYWRKFGAQKYIISVMLRIYSTVFYYIIIQN